MAQRDIGWPDEGTIPKEERILILMVRELSCQRNRALLGLLRGVRSYRHLDDLSASRVASACLESEREDAALLVVLADPTGGDKDALGEELRTVSNPIWRPPKVRFVDSLPKNGFGVDLI